MENLYIKERRKVGIQLPLEEHIEIQDMFRPMLVAYRKHEKIEDNDSDGWFSRFPYCVRQKTIQGIVIGMCKKDYAKIVNIFYDLVKEKIENPYQLIDRLLPGDEFMSIDDKINFLRGKCYAFYLLMDEHNSQIRRVLKLDLFRLIRYSDRKNRDEFIGGLFHSLEHFEVEDKSASNYYDLKDIYDLPFLIASAFAGKLEKSKRNDTDYETYLFLPNGKRFKAIFYLEEESGVYSLRSFYPDNEKKNNKNVTADYPIP